MHAFPRLKSLIALTSLSLLGHTHAAILLEYNFNQTGITASNGGSVSSTDSLITLRNSAGTPSDLHSSSGAGVSGMAGDYAFNNTSSTGMGIGNTGGYTTTPTALATDIGSLSSFTIQGWFKTDGGTIGNGAKLFELFNGSNSSGILLNSENTGVLTLNVDGVKVQSPYTTGYYGSGVWVYFAVSYDGSLSSNNVNFYWGTATSGVALVNGGTLSLNQGSTRASDVGLGLGNGYNSNARPFDGYLDNIRLFGSSALPPTIPAHWDWQSWSNCGWRILPMFPSRAQSCSYWGPAACGWRQGCAAGNLASSTLLPPSMQLPSRFRSQGFTLIELLSALAIVGVLAVLLMSGVGRFKESSRQVKCASNLKTLSQAITANAYENNGLVILAYEYGPRNDVNAMWYEAKSQLASAVGGSDTLLKLAVCPTLYKKNSSPVDTMGNPVRSADGLPYVVNYNIMANSPGDSIRVRMSQISRPSQTILMTDTREMQSGWGQGFSNPAYTSWQRIGTPHGGRANILWCDGHVTLQNPDEVKDKTSL